MNLENYSSKSQDNSNLCWKWKKIAFSLKINNDELEKTKIIIEKLKEIINFEKISFNSDIAKISIIGIGMKNNSGFLLKYSKF